MRITGGGQKRTPVSTAYRSLCACVSGLRRGAPALGHVFGCDTAFIRSGGICAGTDQQARDVHVVVVPAEHECDGDRSGEQRGGMSVELGTVYRCGTRRGCV